MHGDPPAGAKTLLEHVWRRRPKIIWKTSQAKGLPSPGGNAAQKNSPSTTETSSGSQLHCCSPGCDFVVSDRTQAIWQHWMNVHPGREAELKSGHIFWEVETGRKLCIYDLFGCVMMCRVCMTIREVWSTSCLPTLRYSSVTLPQYGYIVTVEQILWKLFSISRFIW